MKVVIAENGKRTIKISKELRDKLADQGHKKETYEDIIRRLIDGRARED